MTRSSSGLLFHFAAIALLSVGCSEEPRRLPTEPNQSSTSGANLKAPAPVLLNPPDLAVVGPANPLILRVENVRASNASFTPSYEIELWNPAGTFKHRSTFVSRPGATSEFSVTPMVEAEVPLLWRVRATYEGHAGPWSGQRTVRVSRAAIVVGSGPTVERGEDTRLSIRVLQQGLTSDCATPTDWTSDQPSIASVANDGTVTPLRLGVVTIAVRCEATVATRMLTVVETWRAAIRFKSCSQVVGDGRACWNGSMAAGATGDVRFELTEQGNVIIGDLSLPAIGVIPFTGAVSGNRLTGSGNRVSCGESGALAVSFEILNDRVDLRIREANAPGCAPNGPFHREWQVVADLDRLTR